MDAGNPFPGLRPFEADESHLFFGRESATDELLRKLRENRFIAVVGTSGSGKSSLVRAGMLPDLYGGFMIGAGSSWRVAITRPGDAPIRALAEALSAPGVLRNDGDDQQMRFAITETVLRRGAVGLVDLIRQARMAAGENILVVVDQFEELFRIKPGSDRGDARDEADAFVKLLLEAVRYKELPIYVMITMRSEYLGDCTRFRDLPEAINAGQYLIPRMTRDQRRRAITGPIAVGGATISPPLVQRLLNDIGDNPDQLPIMQHAMMRTWSFWEADHREGEAIGLAHYEATGGMDEALSRHADEAYGQLPDKESREIATKIFKRLTGRGADNREMRFPATVAELCATAGAEQNKVLQVIDAFRQEGRSFLMPPHGTPLSDRSTIDISHESLIRIWKRLRQWVEEEFQSARIYTRLAETSALYPREAGLWRDPDLQIALKWRETSKPNRPWAERYSEGFDAAMAFLRASKVAARRRQALILGLPLVAAIALVAFGYDRMADRLATSETEASQQAELVAELQAEPTEIPTEDASTVPVSGAGSGHSSAPEQEVETSESTNASVTADAPAATPQCNPSAEIATLTVALAQWKECLEAGSETEKAMAREQIQALETEASIAAPENFRTCADVKQLECQGQTEKFSPGRVYVLARINAPKEETLTLKWLKGGQDFRSVKLKVKQNTVNGFRTYTWKTVDVQGDYEVKLYNSSEKLIGHRTFKIE